MVVGIWLCLSKSCQLVGGGMLSKNKPRIGCPVKMGIVQPQRIEGNHGGNHIKFFQFLTQNGGIAHPVLQAVNDRILFGEFGNFAGCLPYRCI